MNSSGYHIEAILQCQVFQIKVNIWVKVNKRETYPKKERDFCLEEQK